MDNTTLWKAVLADLELDVSKSFFNLWLRPTTLVEIKEVDNGRQIVTVGCRKPYQQAQIEARYYGQIKVALDRLTQKQNELLFRLLPGLDQADTPAGPLLEQIGEQTKDYEYEESVRRVRLRRDYIFDTFAVSSTNEMAHAAASAVAHSPGTAYHLLFLYGGVGVGKTHLMTAIGHEILQQNPKTEMLFFSGEEFMNELVLAIQTKKTSEFKAKYRKAQVILVDDIQFIAGKDSVQEEFFHTFNAIVQNQGQIVLTSDKMPEQMVLLEDRLRSRFEGGLIIDIQDPNLELRTAILNIKAKARGIDLPMDIAQMVAAQINSTRGLEGFLGKLTNKLNTKGEEITLELARGLLGDKEKEMPKRYVPPYEVIEAVGNHFGVKSTQIKGKKRQKEIVTARHVAMFILRNDLNVSLPEVGRVFGGRDHTTVMHAVEKVNDFMNISEQWRQYVENARKVVFGGK